MSSPIRIVGGFALLLLVAVGVLAGLSIHYRTQRNDARALVGRLQRTVQKDLDQMAAQDQQARSLAESVDSATDRADELLSEIEPLKEQTAYDKSRLLDCWVVIKRSAPAGLLSPDLASYPIPQNTPLAPRTSSLKGVRRPRSHSA
jgi:hypothetical protein